MHEGIYSQSSEHKDPRYNPLPRGVQVQCPDDSQGHDESDNVKKELDGRRCNIHCKFIDRSRRLLRVPIVRDWPGLKDGGKEKGNGP